MREMCEMCESKTLDLGEAGTDERVCSGKCQIWPVLSKRLHDFERALATIFKCMICLNINCHQREWCLQDVNNNYCKRLIYYSLLWLCLEMASSQ